MEDYTQEDVNIAVNTIINKVTNENKNLKPNSEPKPFYPKHIRDENKQHIKFVIKAFLIMMSTVIFLFCIGIFDRLSDDSTRIRLQGFFEMSFYIYAILNIFFAKIYNDKRYIGQKEILKVSVFLMLVCLIVAIAS